MTNFIQVSVPEDRLQEVYELLGRSPLIATAPPEPAVMVESGQLFPKGWDRHLVMRMYVESPDSMKGALKFLAQAAGERVWGPDLAKALGFERNQLAGAFGAFGRRVKNRYKSDRWPFEAYRNASDSTYSYEMTPAVAACVLEAAGNE